MDPYQGFDPSPTSYVRLLAEPAAEPEVQPHNTPSAGASSGTTTYQDVFTIAQTDVIPTLTHPWKSTPGGMCNVIAGAVTFVNGDGVVSFTDGSRTVTYSAQAGTFHLNPGDRIVVQYSMETQT